MLNLEVTFKSHQNLVHNRPLNKIHEDLFLCPFDILLLPVWNKKLKHRLSALCCFVLYSLYHKNSTCAAHE